MIMKKQVQKTLKMAIIATAFYSVTGLSAGPTLDPAYNCPTGDCPVGVVADTPMNDSKNSPGVVIGASGTAKSTAESVDKTSP